MGSWPLLLTGGLVLLLLFASGYVAEKLRIPSLLAYLLLGVALSGKIGHAEALYNLAEIGVVLLFLLLGLEFPPSRTLAVARRIWPAGLLDVVLNLVGAALLAFLLGFDLLMAALLGATVYATGSSITVRLLEERQRMANPEAEFILGLLVFEDLVAPLLVALFAGITGEQKLTFSMATRLLGRIFFLTAGAFLVGHFVLPRLRSLVDKYQGKDIIALLGLGVAVSCSGLALYLELSPVLGAFLGGMMLAEINRVEEFDRMLFPIREVTLPFFFLWFGSQVYLDKGIPYAFALILLLCWSAMGKVLTGYWGGKMYGLSPRVSLRAGFSLIARGEFSAVLASLGPEVMRLFGGVYVILSVILGVMFFQKAPSLARLVQGFLNRFQNPALRRLPG